MTKITSLLILLAVAARGTIRSAEANIRPTADFVDACGVPPQFV